MSIHFSQYNTLRDIVGGRVRARENGAFSLFNSLRTRACMHRQWYTQSLGSCQFLEFMEFPD